MNPAEAHPLEKRHPIQVVARRSGLTQDLLRAWEKRYAVVEPARSPGGQRLYSDHDIERLRLLRLAVNEGRRISAVAALSNAALEELIAVEAPIQGAPTVPTPVDSAAMLECLDAIRQFDAARLEDVLHRQLLQNGSTSLIEGLITPLMGEVGRLWHVGRMPASHEHLATQVLRSFVARVLLRSRSTESAGSIVVATTAGQQHELGALMAAAVAAQEGWSVVFLGADLPSEDIVRACRDVDARLLALGFTVRSETVDDLGEIRAVIEGLGNGALVIVGGDAACRDRDAITAMGARVVSGPSPLRALLSEHSSV